MRLRRRRSSVPEFGRCRVVDCPGRFELLLFSRKGHAIVQICRVHALELGAEAVAGGVIVKPHGLDGWVLVRSKEKPDALYPPGRSPVEPVLDIMDRHAIERARAEHRATRAARGISGRWS